MNILNAVQQVATELRDKFIENNNALMYKSSVEPDNGSITGVPEIYTFTVPHTSLQSGYPEKCPCVVLTLSSLSLDETRHLKIYTVVASLAVCNASIVESCKCDKTGNNIYEFRESADYSTGTDADRVDTTDESLIMQSHMFTESIYAYLRNIKDIPIKVQSPSYADAGLPEYPYATSNIQFTITLPDIDTTYSELY